MLRIARLSRVATLVRWAGGAWFALSTSHGVALLLVPALLPLCRGGGGSGATAASGPLATALVAVGIHVVAMLAVMGIVTSGADRSARIRRSV